MEVQAAQAVQAAATASSRPRPLEARWPPEVMVLRRFRDRHLLTNTVGRAFVGVYYASSPPIAEFIRTHQTARAIVRSWISFAILLVKYPTWTLCAMVLLLATLVSMGRVRGRAGGVFARPPTNGTDRSLC